MNELVFFLHVAMVTLFAHIALRMGKSALAAMAALLGVLANLFVSKQTLLFGLEVTCADAYAVGGFLALNLYQERYGKDEAKKLIWISFLALALFGIMATIHLLYKPSGSDWAHAHFSPILRHSPRIVIASFITYFIVQRLDVEIFGWLRKKIGSFPTALFFSLLISQVFDTVLFSALGLYGLVTSLVQITLFSILIKWIIVGSMTLMTRLRRAV